MKEQNSEKIVAYRIGEGLFCVDCYEKAAKTLKSVQDPKDPQVTIPAKPITKEDIHIFICKDCMKVFGSPNRRDMTDPVDLINHCVDKVAFLTDFFCGGKVNEQFEISEEGSNGLVFILEDLEEELRLISRKMTHGTR